MPMNIVIQEKRRELGLTQEQLAQYLGVSTPAVSKWEKGVTCPDIAILPSLARLLKIDLNTLFCFREELTQQELNDFCNLLKSTAEEYGIAAAFDRAEEMMRSYPNSESLMLNVTLLLDGMLQLSDVPDSERTGLFAKTGAWYRHLSESSEPATRNFADYMLVNRYIDRGDLEQAQGVLDTMPDRNSILAEYADKFFLQVKVYMNQGRAAYAAKELEKALLTAINKAQILLYNLADAELAAGEPEKAKNIAKVNQDMVKAFDLWECSAYIPALSLAMELKDKEQILPLLQGILQSIQVPWNMGASCLYHRIADRQKKAEDKAMTNALLHSVAQYTERDFLRDDPRFQSILERCNQILAGKGREIEVQDPDNLIGDIGASIF